MIKCRDRLVARAVLPPPPVRPAVGSGASIGPIRRVILPGIVCVSLGAGITTAVLRHIAGEPKTPEPTTTTTHGATPVPEPGTLALLGAAVAGLALVRRRP